MEVAYTKKNVSYISPPGLPGGENSIEEGGHDRVKKLDRHNWMPQISPTA